MGAHQYEFDRKLDLDNRNLFGIFPDSLFRFESPLQRDNVFQSSYFLSVSPYLDLLAQNGRRTVFFSQPGTLHGVSFAYFFSLVVSLLTIFLVCHQIFLEMECTGFFDIFFSSISRDDHVY